MTENERDEIKDKIVAQMYELEGDIKSHKESSKPVEPDNAIGRLTRMEAINAKSISEANLNSAKARLVRLQNALKRLDSDNYGICSKCEEPIPIKRLLLLPEATRCVGCMQS